ncbi:MAG: XRE family transcriptional regulator [Candidatus Latescibacteria bacterium]|nr:XRE family transcriptional regulator [Candidatus Latescibacterota bacterium]
MTASITHLGQFLKQIRQEKEFSMRHVEHQSKVTFPDDKKRHISHTYLRKLEEGRYETPSPLKLKTLALIYGVEHSELLRLADYLEGRSGTPVRAQQVAEKTPQENPDLFNPEIASKLRNHLEANGIHADYFFQSLLSLSKTSLSVVNRLVSVMSVQEREIRKNPKHRVMVQE